MARETLNLAYKKSVMIQEGSKYPTISSVEYSFYKSSESGRIKKLVILGFGEFPAAYRHSRLYSAKLKAKLRISSTITAKNTILAPPASFAEFTPSETNWTNTPNPNTWEQLGSSSVTNVFSENTFDVTVPESYSTDSAASRAAAKLLNMPIGFLSEDYTEKSGAYLLVSSAPSLEVEFDNSALVMTQVTTGRFTSGYVNPHTEQTFTWEIAQNDPDGYCAVGPFLQASAVFRWRKKGESSWKKVTVKGSSQMVTIPANTFPVGSVEWYVSLTDDAGQSSSTPIYTISTQDATMNAGAKSPASEIVTDAQPIVFTWWANSNNGTETSRSELQYSADEATWVTFASVEGSEKSYTADPTTFSPGQIYWRVRAYNADDNAGPWSAVKSFIFLAAPKTPVVNASSAPFSTINWQTNAQQAYEVFIDGESVGTFFGEDTTYTLTDYLTDGQHSAGVRVQNSLGLWSDIGSTSFTVANLPGPAVSLEGFFTQDASLVWSSESAEMQYTVYRDGKRIGTTASNEFVDRFSLGQHDYWVVNLLPDGYYTKSNVVSGETKTSDTLIDSLANPGGWVRLKLSENSQSEQLYSYQRQAVLQHYLGAEYPSLELSSFLDYSGNFDVAFKDEESAAAFEALYGQPVVLKARGKEVLVGALLQIEKRRTDFYTVYTFSLQRIEWEDFVDDSNP